MRWRIICICGHTFTRATICRKNLRTWDCPKAHNNEKHETHAADFQWAQR